jgi:hypothetical protein
VNISHLTDSYGYMAVFVLVGAESLGIPVPGETALIVAGTYAGHTHGLNPWIILLVAGAAAVIGDNIGFWIGDKGGYRLARRYGYLVRPDDHKLKIARYVFGLHGPKVCSSAASCPSCAPTPPSWPAPAACAGASSCPPTPPAGLSGPGFIPLRLLFGRQRPPVRLAHH